MSHIDAVMAFGKRRVRNGAYVYFMDKSARRKAERALGTTYSRIANNLDIYVVQSLHTGEVITTAHRKVRMKW